LYHSHAPLAFSSEQIYRAPVAFYEPSCHSL
jgi:hypothetical protein